MRHGDSSRNGSCGPRLTCTTLTTSPRRRLGAKPCRSRRTIQRCLLMSSLRPRSGSASSKRSSPACSLNRPQRSSPRLTSTGRGAFRWSLFTALPRVPAGGATWSMICWMIRGSASVTNSGSSATTLVAPSSIRRRCCGKRSGMPYTSSTRQVSPPRCRRSWSSATARAASSPRLWLSTPGTECGAPSPTSRSTRSISRRSDAKLLREAIFIKPLPNVRRVVFIATPHRGSYLTEYRVTELLGRFLTLPVRIVQTGVELARNAGDFKVNPRTLGSGSLFGMTPNNPVLQTMATTPIAPGVHAHSIIAVAGNGPVEGSNDGVVEYSSSHLDGVDSEYIVRSTHSTQSNPYTIEEVRRILLLHAAEVCGRISCGYQPAPPSAGMQALTLR